MKEPLYPHWRLERLVTAVETIETSLEILAEKQSTPWERYEEVIDIQDSVERRFVKATEASLDIGRTILIAEFDQRTDSNPETMRALGARDVLSERVTAEMVEAARFRNVLAHTYGMDIDHKLVYEALNDLDRFQSFLVEVRDHLEEVGAFESDNAEDLTR